MVGGGAGCGGGGACVTELVDVMRTLEYPSQKNTVKDRKFCLLFRGFFLIP